MYAGINKTVGKILSHRCMYAQCRKQVYVTYETVTHSNGVTGQGPPRPAARLKHCCTDPTSKKGNDGRIQALKLQMCLFWQTHQLATYCTSAPCTKLACKTTIRQLCKDLRLQCFMIVYTYIYRAFLFVRKEVARCSHMVVFWLIFEGLCCHICRFFLSYL